MPRRFERHHYGYLGLALLLAVAILLFMRPTEDEGSVVSAPPAPPSRQAALPEKADSSSSTTQAREEPEAAAPDRAPLQALMGEKEVQSLLQNEDNSLKELEVVEGSGVRTTKFQHYHNGVEVVGSQARVHRGPAGEQISSELMNIVVDTQPSVSADEAQRAAVAKHGKGSAAKGPAQLKILPSEDRQSGELVYLVRVGKAKPGPTHEVWVSAKTGKIIADWARRESW